MPAKNASVNGIFRDQAGVEEAVDALRSAEFRNTDISVLLPDHRCPQGPARKIGGAVIDGTLGWLAGIGVLSVPGLGRFITAGPVMGLLACPGAKGAGRSLESALAGLGIPKPEIKSYVDQIQKGGLLVSVQCDNPLWTKKAENILGNAGK